MKRLVTILLLAVVLVAPGILFAQEASLPVRQGEDILFNQDYVQKYNAPPNSTYLIAHDNNHWQSDGSQFADPSKKAELLPDGRLLAKGMGRKGIGDWNIIVLKDPAKYTGIGAKWTPFHLLWDIDKYHISKNPHGFINSRPEGHCFNFDNFQ